MVGVALVAAACGGSDDATVTVFAASSLTDAFGELAEDFEAANPGVDVEVSFAGSAQLARQVADGAPADVFAAADERTMAVAVDAGAVEGTPATFATNTAVVVAAPGADRTVADLDDDDLVLAVCAEEVPCGAAAVELLDALGIDASPDTLEPNVRSVLTKVELGEADLGIVYRTDAEAAAGGVTTLPLPPEAEVRVRYPISPTRGADATADDFVAFVLSDHGREVLARYGFGLP